jgi:hypothetical protein
MEWSRDFTALVLRFARRVAAVAFYSHYGVGEDI